MKRRISAKRSDEKPAGVSNAEIAKTLMDLRQMMEFAGEPYFEFMAYEKAAASIAQAAPLADVILRGELEKIPGVGETIAKRIREIVETGTCSKLEGLLKRYPRSLLELFEVQGLGMKTVHILFGKLHIASADDLERAVAEGKLEHLPRMGKKTVQNIKRGLLMRRGRARRWPIGIALPLAEGIVARLQASTPVDHIAYAGCDARSRRWATSTSCARPLNPKP